MSSQSERSTLLDTWAETSAHVFDSMVAANRAAFAALGVEATTDEEVPAERVEPAEDLPEWHAETTADAPETVSVGDRFEFTKTITDDHVRSFAASNGDTHPLHLDDEFAERTRFCGRIAHGTLVSGLISAALARVPGLVIYLSQDLEFHNPVRIGDRITADCEIVEDLGGGRLRLRTTVAKDDQQVIDGEAVVLIDEAPA